jgi:hypothetical protein
MVKYFQNFVEVVRKTIFFQNWWSSSRDFHFARTRIWKTYRKNKLSRKQKSGWATSFMKRLKIMNHFNFCEISRMLTNFYSLIQTALGRRNFKNDIMHVADCSTSSRRKPGWRFTAGSTYGCSWQLVGCQKNVDLFMILGVFFVEVMHSFFTVLIICIFPTKFTEKEN